MCQRHSLECHSVSGEREAVAHVPSVTVSVVVTYDKDFRSRQRRQQVDELVASPNLHITQVDDSILRLYNFIPELDDAVLPAIRPVTPYTYIFVVKMCVGDGPNF